MLKINLKYVGIVYIVLSAFFFAGMNLFIGLAEGVPVLQKCFFRNIVAVFFSLILLLRTKGAVKTGKGHLGDLLVRSIAGTLGIFCNFYAIGNMNIADASILNKLSPFFAIVFSVFVLKEKPKWAEWLAVAVAFVGALFVVKPFPFTAQAIPAISGVLGGLGAGLAYTFVRKMGKAGVNGNLIIFFFSAFSCLVTLPVLIFDYHEMGLQNFLFLMGAGVCATGGQIFITKAYAKAPAKEISVYDYSIVLFAALLGFFFLGEVPDGFSFVGYAVIVLAAVGNWYFHRRADKKAALDASAPCAEPSKEDPEPNGKKEEEN